MVNKPLLVGLSLASSFALAGLDSSSAQAAVVITGQEVSGNVEFSYSGSLNLTGFTFSGTDNWGLPANTQIVSGSPSFFQFGVPASQSYDSYGTNAVVNYPSTLGTPSIVSTASVFSGDFLSPTYVSGFTELLLVPAGYLSGNSLSGTASFTGSFATLGIDAANGPYTWNLSNGETITMQFDSTEVPEPLTLFGASAAIAFGAGFKRRKSGKN
ncbi:MAG: hypothetical protein RLZZ490_131 [Cyanobacteriota bacterium]